MSSWPALYADDGFDKHPGIRAKGPIVREKISDEQALATVKDFIAASLPTLTRQPINQLKYPYIAPGATYNDLWDWDAYFTACAIPDTYLEYSQGSIINLLDSPLRFGRPPKRASADGWYDYYLHPYPLQAQFAYIVGCRMKVYDWIEPLLTKLIAIMDWHEKTTQDNEGFFRWRTLTGIDNNPSVYGRPPGMTAGVDLAAFHYREYRALFKLMEIFGRNECAIYRERAQELQTLVRTAYWDQVDRFFYDVDRNVDDNVPGRQKITWHTHLKFRNCGCLFALWGGLATKEQATYMAKWIMDENDFLSVGGLRTHSRRDPIYNNEISGGPSNWQGPVWGLNTFLTAYGLARYGFQSEALEVAMRLIQTFALDIRQNGCLHEYYHGDTGQPLINPGFLDWNILGGSVIDDIKNNSDCTSLDLLSTE